MPLEIKITGDQAEVETTLARLHTTLHKPDIETMNIDDLLAVAKRRFAEQGFGVSLIQQNPPEDAPTEAEAEAIVNNIVDNKLAEAKRKKKPKAEPEVEAANAKAKAADTPPVDEADKNYVVEELTRRFGDNRQKLKAKAFIDRIAGRHGGIRISLLDPELFPGIRAEMETEFGLKTGNGAGGQHA